MATLQSPGVQVNVIDESFYTPSAPGTVPLLFVTSAQDKINPSGTVALGTTAANAGKVWLITSQRDLTDTFGTPVFYTDQSSNPLHGNELNEYGLQAAYSSLGVSSRAYIVRADLDLVNIVPTSSEPEGSPVGGTYWLDTTSSVYGIREWNSSTTSFSTKTPIVLGDDSPANQFNVAAPAASVGIQGDYCMVITNTNANQLYYKQSATVWSAVQDNFGPNSDRLVTVGPHYTYPSYTSSTPSGSIWIITTTPANGANWKVKLFNSGSQSWVSVAAPIYDSVKTASYTFDKTGGKAIVPGTLFIESNPSHNTLDTAIFKVWRKASAGITTVSGLATSTAATSSTNYVFNIRESNLTDTWGTTKTVTINTSSSGLALGSLVPDALAAQGLTYVSANWNATTNILTMTHSAGGQFELFDGANTPLATLGFSAYNVVTLAGTANLYTAPTGDFYTGSTPFTFIATNWKSLAYEASSMAPYTTPADGTLWYSSVVDEVDILYHNGSTWVDYVSNFGSCSPNGPIVSATMPDDATGQSDGTALVTGDIWIDTSDIDMYGRNVYVFNSTLTAGNRWVKQDVTDQSTPSGWLFADARAGTTGGTSTTKPGGTIKNLLQSGYLDPDAPDPALYPKGMRLWNTRRSGFNVKKYVQGHINLNAQNARQSNAAMSGYYADRWVTQYPTAADGGPQFGRLGQRAQVVNALKELIDSNSAIRDTDTLGFNLIATPGYPEAIQSMTAFNTDRGITAFVLGDTPFRLAPTATALRAWGLNTNMALDNDDVGAVTYDEYMAMYYPSGYATDNTGNKIVVPPSHMMLRTIINSDAKSYPWFAPAGTRRGGVDNVTSVGYITDEGEFKPAALHQALRDVLQDPAVAINPIATLTGVGIVAYGQRTRAKNASSLDRINVARLVCYLRKQLDVLARPYLFEPNDTQTRREIKAAAESLMLELVGQRALYDFVIVCDETNNTPARIDRNELYLDIAIEPVKSVEFIYIPLRLKNTGEIAAGV